MSRSGWTRTALLAAVASFLALYAPVIAPLIRDWTSDANYSHGFLIPPLAGYVVWERRARLASLEITPSFLGLFGVGAGLAALAAGTLGAEFFLTRVSLIPLLAGAIVFVAGWRHLRALLFPLALLLLMIPIPAILFNQLAFPLQLIASQFGAAVLSNVGIPVLREGNVIVLSNTTLEVAEACSGIRSLVSLLTIAVMLGHFGSSRPGVRVALALATVPIAILTNGIRVAGTGVAAHYYGAAAAEGFLHAFSGWLVFVLALAMLWTLEQSIRRFMPTLRASHA